MRERGKKKEGQRNVIPPQIFNGQEFRGVRNTRMFFQLFFIGHIKIWWTCYRRSWKSGVIKYVICLGFWRLWYCQWRWCPWGIPWAGTLKAKGEQWCSHIFVWFCTFELLLNCYWLFLYSYHWAFENFEIELIIWFQIEPVKTGAVAPEVNKMKVGKLEVKEEEKTISKKEVRSVAIDLANLFLICPFLLSSFHLFFSLL